MKIRFNEVKEIKNSEKIAINKETQYQSTSGNIPTDDDKKKLEKPKYSYKPTEEIRTMGNQENIRGKLR